MEVGDGVGSILAARSSMNAVVREGTEETGIRPDKDKLVWLGEERNQQGQLCHTWVQYSFLSRPPSGKIGDEHSLGVRWVDLKRFCHMALAGGCFRHERVGAPLLDHLKATGLHP